MTDRTSLDTLAPQLEVTAIPAATYALALTLTGMCRDDSLISSVRVQTSNASVDAVTTTGFQKWSAAIDLSVGAQRLVVSCTDVAGNVTSVPLDVQRLVTAVTPVVHFVFPPSAIMTDQSSLPVRVQVDGVAPIAWVKIAGVPAVQGTTGEWAASVALPPDGVSTLTAEVEDVSGQTSQASLQVRQDARIWQTLQSVEGSAGLVACDVATQDLVTIDLASGVAHLLSAAPSGDVAPSASVRACGPATRLTNETLIIANDDAPSTSLFSVSVADGQRHWVSGPTLGSGPLLGLVSAVQKLSEGMVVVADATTRAIFEVDVMTGQRRILSGDGVGAGPVFSRPDGLAYDALNDRVLVADGEQRAVFSVARAGPSRGDRTVVSNDSVGAGAGLPSDRLWLHMVAPSGAWIGRAGDTVSFYVDLETGDRVQPPYSPACDANTIGAPALVSRELVFTVADRDLLLARNVDTLACRAVFGNRTGTTPVSGARAFALDAKNGRAFVTVVSPYVAAQHSLLSVSLADGSVAPVPYGAGTGWTELRGVAIDGTHLLVSDYSTGQVIQVDPDTGDRVLLALNATTSGDTLFVPSPTGPIVVHDVDFAGDVIVFDRSGEARYLSTLDSSLYSARALVLAEERWFVAFDDEIVSMDAFTLTNRRIEWSSTAALPDPVSAFAIDAAATRVWLSTQSAQLVEIDLASARRTILQAGADRYTRLWSEGDGRVLYGLSATHDGLHAIDTVTGARAWIAR